MDNMAEKLKSMLDDPATMNTLSAVMESLKPSNESASSTDGFSDSDESSAPSASSFSQPDLMANVGNLMNQLNSVDDPRINLLNSLKPYMGKTRSTKMDQAIKLIQISKIASAFKL